MRRSRKAIIPLTAFLAMGFVELAAASEVTIFRGSAVQTVVIGQPNGPPTVLRGGGSAILPLSPPVARAAPAEYPRIAAGRTLWLVDKSSRRITACTLRGTATIGRRKIRCTRY